MTGHTDNLWYVLVDNQSYGPYSNADMVSFVDETHKTAFFLHHNIKRFNIG